MSCNDEGNSSLSFTSFIRNRVSRFGRFGLSKKYQRVLVTPLSDDQRKSVIDKLTKKGLQPQHEWNKSKFDPPLPKKPDEFDRKKVTFQNHSRNSVFFDSPARLMEELLSSAPSSPTMSERCKFIRPGALNISMDAGQMSDVSQSAPSSPSIDVGYYDTIPLLPECRDNPKEFFHPTNVPFKSFFPYQANDPCNQIPLYPDDRSRFVIGSEEPTNTGVENVHVRRSKVQSLAHLMEKLQIKDLLPTFKIYGIDDLRSFTKITEGMLDRMQITSAEVKTKIMTALELLSETEDDPESEVTDKPKHIDNLQFQSDLSDQANLSQSLIQKPNLYQLNRSHRTSREMKNCYNNKIVPTGSYRTSSGHRKHQSSRRSGSSSQKSRSYQPQISDLPHCKETSIIHQHIHHHHHVGSFGIPSQPPIQWKLPNPRESEKTRIFVERKLQSEQIDLTDIPYSDQKGSSGIPLRLIERYAYELDKDIRDMAIAIESSRSAKLLEKNREVRSNMDAILSDQFLNCDGIKTDCLDSFLISIGLPMYRGKIRPKCRNLQTFLLYSDEALVRNFNIHPSHVRWIRREASFFPIGFLSQISHVPQQRFRTSSDAKYFALDRV